MNLETPDLTKVLRSLEQKLGNRNRHFGRTEPLIMPRQSLVQVKVPVRDAREAIQAYLLLTWLHQEDPWTGMELKEHLGQMAYANSYEGTWGFLASLLESPGSKEEVAKLLLTRYSTNAIFGTIVPKAVKMRNRLAYVDIKNRQGPKPIPKQRKRGYDDKGSRRPDVKWLPSTYPELEGPPRADRRHLVHFGPPVSQKSPGVRGESSKELPRGKDYL